MALRIGQVADLAGVSVRTLRHYHQIGLLAPSGERPSGYRLYAERDLERLQQILFFRKMGLGLKEIGSILESPTFDRIEALRLHRDVLAQERDRLAALLVTVDTTIKAFEEGRGLSGEDLLGGFGHAPYADEARERWGRTEAWRQSQERTKNYTAENWAAIERERREIEAGLAGVMERDPADPEVQALVRRHRRLIDERFYQTTTKTYRGLAEMYVTDPRFAAYYEKVRPGLADFMRRAMLVHCEGEDQDRS